MDKKGILEKYYKDEFDVWVKRVKSRGFTEMDAEDIVQEAFATALKYLHTFDPNLSSIATWFTRILNQTQRKLSRDVLVSVEISEEDIFTQEADEYEGDEHAKRKLKEIIAGEKLPHHRNILYLHYIMGMKVGDVSRQLDESVETVKTTVKRFKAKLGELLGCKK